VPQRVSKARKATEQNCSVEKTIGLDGKARKRQASAQWVTCRRA
jgi:hypothetical protein